jgi:hypothetical protein
VPPLRISLSRSEFTSPLDLFCVTAMPRPPLAAALFAILSLGLLCSARPAALSLHPRADIPASQASTTKLSDSQIKKIQGLLNKHANER